MPRNRPGALYANPHLAASLGKRGYDAMAGVGAGAAAWWAGDQIASKMMRSGGGYKRKQLSKVTVCAPKCVKKELKFIDKDDYATMVSGSTIPIQLCVIPQGITESSRIGRMAFIHSIAISATFTVIAPSTLDEALYVRLVLIQDKQANGAAPAYADVFSGSKYQLNFPNLSNAKRFKIWKTWDRVMQPTAGVTGSNMMTGHRFEDVVQIAKKGNGIPIEYTQVAAPDPGALTQVESNNFYLMAISSINGSGLTYLDVNTRVRFTD